MKTHFYAWRNTETVADLERRIKGGTGETEKTLQVTEEGFRKASELAQRVIDCGIDLDCIYASDLQRAKVVAEAVQSAYQGIERNVPLEFNMQLREIVHGPFEGMLAEDRNRISAEYIDQILDQALASNEKNDPSYLWRFHPITKEWVGRDVKPIELADYIQQPEVKAETILGLYKRGIVELWKIANIHPGQKIGIGTHAIFLSSLRSWCEFNQKPESERPVFLAPYWGTEIQREGKSVVSAPAKVGHCDLLHFIYDHEAGEFSFAGEMKKN
jgi:broad specificity phosphatase PhoE